MRTISRSHCIFALWRAERTSGVMRASVESSSRVRRAMERDDACIDRLPRGRDALPDGTPRLP